jgi:hypothetical protein
MQGNIVIYIINSEAKPKAYRPFSAALEICPTDVAR